ARAARSTRVDCVPTLLALVIARPLGSTLFPYTTLFRSVQEERELAWPLAQVDRLRDIVVAPRLERFFPVSHHGVRGQRDYRDVRSEEHTSELQSRENLVCRLLLEKKKKHLLIQTGHVES